MRVSTAIIATMLLFAAVWAVSAPVDQPGLLDVPPRGGVAAATLDDGTPVFVSHTDDGHVDVLFPVSTHLDRLVVWCPDEGVFVQPVGATLYDQRGGWVTGPAAHGLAHYESILVDDGARVAVGDRQDPPTRAERPGAAPPVGGVCAGSEGARDGVDVALPGTVALLDLPRHVGQRVVVESRLHLDGHGDAWLCPTGVDACRHEQVRVEEPWAPDTWRFGRFEGHADGAFLVRVDGPRRVSELIEARPDPANPLELDLRDVGSSAPAPESVWVFATVAAFDADAGTVTLADLEPWDGDPSLLPERDGGEPLTFPLVEDRMPQLVDDRETLPDPYAMIHLYPEEFEAVLAPRARTSARR